MAALCPGTLFSPGLFQIFRREHASLPDISETDRIKSPCLLKGSQSLASELCREDSKTGSSWQANSHPSSGGWGGRFKLIRDQSISEIIAVTASRGSIALHIQRLCTTYTPPFHRPSSTADYRHLYPLISSNVNNSLCWHPFLHRIVLSYLAYVGVQSRPPYSNLKTISSTHQHHSLPILPCSASWYRRQEAARGIRNTIEDLHNLPSSITCFLPRTSLMPWDALNGLATVSPFLRISPLLGTLDASHPPG